MNRHNSIFLAALAVSFLSLLECAASAFAAPTRPLYEYALFAGHSVNLSTSLNSSPLTPTGIVGSNGNITVGTAGTNVQQIEAGGSLLGNPSFLHVTNNVLFNGGVVFGGQSTVGGTLDSGFSATLGGTISGNIRSGGDVTISGTALQNVNSNGSVFIQTADDVVGNVTARQNVTLQSSAAVGGNVTYGGSLSLGSFATIGGSATQASTTTIPDFFSPVTIPTVASFTAGGPDVTLPVFDDRTLAPGVYGDLSFQSSATLHLSPGKYYFDSFTSVIGFSTIDYDLTQPGTIEIYVVGDLNIDLMVPKINGSILSSTFNPLASRVLIESLSDIIAGRDIVGTLFAPQGDVTINNATRVWGAIFAGNDANLTGTTLHHVPFVTPIPEPGICALTALTTIAMSYVARRKRNAN